MHRRPNSINILTCCKDPNAAQLIIKNALIDLVGQRYAHYYSTGIFPNNFISYEPDITKEYCIQYLTNKLTNHIDEQKCEPHKLIEKIADDVYSVAISIKKKDIVLQLDKMTTSDTISTVFALSERIEKASPRIYALFRGASRLSCLSLLSYVLTPYSEASLAIATMAMAITFALHIYLSKTAGARACAAVALDRDKIEATLIKTLDLNIKPRREHSKPLSFIELVFQTPAEVEPDPNDIPEKPSDKKGRRHHKSHCIPFCTSRSTA